MARRTTKNLSIHDICCEFSEVAFSGRVSFPKFAVIAVCRQIKLDYESLSRRQKFMLKSDMINEQCCPNYGSGVKNAEDYINMN